MHKKILPFLLIFFISITSYSQYRIDYGVSLGASNYLGEFGGGEGEGRDFVLDMELSFMRWTAGGFFRYRLAPKAAVKGSLNYIRLTGDDKKSDNPARKARNLNFKNDMFEFIVTGEFYVYQIRDLGKTGRYENDFNLYLFAGVGAFYSNPMGQSTTGEWVALKPLATEGASYSNINLTVPVGLGFYYTLQKKYRVGLEIGWRTTFTDYIDDASGTYAYDYDGISNKTDARLLNQINSEFYQGENGLLPTNYDAGSKRGNPNNKDSYMTATVNLSWAIRGKSRFYKSNHGWVLGRRRSKSKPKF